MEEKYCETCKARKPSSHFLCEGMMDQITAKLKEKFTDADFLKQGAEKLLMESIGGLLRIMEETSQKVRLRCGADSSEYRAVQELVSGMKNSEYGKWWPRRQ